MLPASQGLAGEAGSGSQRQRMLTATEKLDQSSQRIQHGVKALAETEVMLALI
jgi:hypothetical protein